MKESYRQKPLLTLAVGVATVALLLAGCGGGGTVKKDPKPQMVDLSGLAADVMTQAGTLDLKAGASGDIGEVTFTCAAGGDDCSVTVTVTDGKAAASATGGMVTAAASKSYTTRKNNERKALVAKITAQAKSMADAIMVEALQTADGGPGGSVLTAADKAHEITVMRDSSAPATVTITVDGAGADAPKFMEKDGMFVRTMQADDDGNVVVEKMMVSTNIESPKAVPFVEFKVVEPDFSESEPQKFNSSAGPVGNQDCFFDPVPCNALDILVQLSPGQSGLPISELSKLVKSSNFTANTEVTLSFRGDSGGADTEYRTAGTYNGSPGTYYCNFRSECQVKIGDTDTGTDGLQLGITALSGWAFIPDEGATTLQPDYDYLYWGFWLKQTTDKDGVVTYDEVETFAESRLNASPTGSNGIDNVKGSAEYKGDANGVYVKNEYNTDGSIASATSGHFTADASLTANFYKGSSIAVNDYGKVTGTINNFMLSGGEANTWSVALSGTRTNDSNVSGTTGTANGGVDGKDGSFTTTFYGPTPADPNDSTSRLAPGSMAGEFNADFSNGTVAGAFGVQKQ